VAKLKCGTRSGEEGDCAEDSGGRKEKFGVLSSKHYSTASAHIMATMQICLDDSPALSHNV
jgi:hypothetical protein